MKVKDLKIAHNQKSVIIMQKISTNHDNSKCYGIIKIEIQQNQTADSVEFVIRDSHVQFNNMTNNSSH